MLLGILECGRNKPEWLADHGGFADWFPRLLGPVAPEMDYRVWRADQLEFPGRTDLCDGWLLTGSPNSVYENLPWQTALSDFLRQAREERPLVGICYGHQHIHHALGGKVAKQDDWGVGVQSYPIRNMPDWLGPDWLGEADASGRHFDLIALHQDHVVEPAPGTSVLAANDESPFAVTQIGDNVLTFQPHPELTPEQAVLIYQLHRKDMGEASFVRAMTSFGLPCNERRAAAWIVSFLHSRTKGDRP